jgi:3-oxoacyl-[acyl-carrier protein] reductase
MPRIRTVLVTGASRGIGKAIAARLGRERGLRVLAPTRRELDLASLESLRAWLAGAPAVDILVNNAGINILKDLEAIDPGSLQAMLSVNVTAPVLLAAGLAAGMKRRRWGRIINISSIWGLSSRERRSLYSVTKFGLNGLTKALSKELGPWNILVNSVCPGFVDTELTRRNLSPAERKRLAKAVPLRRFAQAREIAEVVAFLASDANSYLTGQCLAVDGGFL